MTIRKDPTVRRLRMPQGYRAAAGESLIPWAYVTERLEQEANYWLATTRPDTRPHVTPVWGVWVDDALYFTGIPTARWARNLAVNAAAAVHLESGIDVVVVEGSVEDLPVVSELDVAARIIAAWDSKYGRLHPEPAMDGMFRLNPNSIRAWTKFPDDATRWDFAADLPVLTIRT